MIAFFGVGAVGGTFWLCTATLDAPALAAGLALGLMTGAVLLVNNFRDVEADARVGRRTLAIVAGPRATAWIFAGMMLAALCAVARRSAAPCRTVMSGRR